MTPQPIILKRAASRRMAGLGLAALVMIGMGGAVAACTPTIRLQVDPIQIYAKLDADVRIKLDKELQDMLRENPNLF